MSALYDQFRTSLLCFATVDCIAVKTLNARSGSRLIRCGGQKELHVLKPDETVAHQSIYRAVGRHPIRDTRIHAIRNEVLEVCVRHDVRLIEFCLTGYAIRSSKSPYQQSGEKWRDHKRKHEPIDSVSPASIGDHADDKCQRYPKRDNPKHEISPFYPARNLTARRPAVASTLRCFKFKRVVAHAARPRSRGRLSATFTAQIMSSKQCDRNLDATEVARKRYQCALALFNCNSEIGCMPRYPIVIGGAASLRQHPIASTQKFKHALAILSL